MHIAIALALFAFSSDAPRADVIVVVGAAGAPEYASQFAEWAQRWQDAATKGHAHATIIGRESSPPLGKGGTGGVETVANATRAIPPNPPLERGGEERTDRERLQAALVAAKDAERPLWLVLIGHGTFDRRTAKFNLRGPDVSAQDLKDWLQALDRPVAVIDCTSASAPFMGTLAGPKRIVVTATKGGAEQNFARFGDFLSQAITDPAADLDKDDQVSLWEAYLAASRRTVEFYKTDGRLLTEHALLDDNGDGQGTRADEFVGLQPAPAALARAETLDGAVAHQWHLIPSTTEAALPAEVRERRDALELAIIALRRRKKELGEDEYYAKLEPLLVELARLTLNK